MASNIPGRRISYGETFYTDWAPRGGDCALLRAQALIKSSAAGTVYVSLQTRSEEDTSPTTVDTYYPSSAPKLLELSALGVKTAIYLATQASGSPNPRGFKEQVRFKIAFNAGSSGDYYVIRLFAPVFFDNSIPGFRSPRATTMWMNTQIIALDTATNQYYTPWFPRGADNAMFMMEVIQNTFGSDLTVTVWTKNREDEGSAPGSSAGTFSTLTGGFREVACTGLKELVRFRISARAVAVGEGAIFRFLPPTWYDTAV